MPRGGKREGAGAKITTGSSAPENRFVIKLPAKYARKLDELGGNDFLKNLAILACDDKLRHIDQVEHGDPAWDRRSD